MLLDERKDLLATIINLLKEKRDLLSQKWIIITTHGRSWTWTSDDYLLKNGIRLEVEKVQIG